MQNWIREYLEQLQPGPNGLLGGNAFIVVVRCSFYGLVHLFYKRTAEEKSWRKTDHQTRKGEKKIQMSDKISIRALYLIDSVSIWTGAILSSKNFTISRKGLLGCFGLPSFFVISFCKNSNRHDHKSRVRTQNLTRVKQMALQHSENGLTHGLWRISESQTLTRRKWALVQVVNT